MTLRSLQTQLLALTPDEKYQTIQLLTSSLVTPWQGISKTSDLMGGEARIRDTRIPVWLLVGYTRMGLSEAKTLDNYPTLTATDLVNAWSYASANPDEIERASDKKRHNRLIRVYRDA